MEVSEISGEFRCVKSVGDDDARSVLGIIKDPTEVLADDTDEDKSEAVEKQEKHDNSGEARDACAAKQPPNKIISSESSGQDKQAHAQNPNQAQGRFRKGGYAVNS